MRIEDVMVRKVWSCQPGDMLSRAASLMWDHDIGSLPVVDVEGRPVAMITDRDICICCYRKSQSPAALPVENAMSKGVVSAQTDQRIEDVEAAMCEAQVRRLPVVNADGRLAGIVSIADIARVSTKVKSNGLEKTLAAISMPPSRAGRLEAGEAAAD